MSSVSARLRRRELRDVILGPDVRVSSEEPGVLEVEGLTAEQIGDAAARNGFAIHELTPEKTSLEEAFMELTREETEYRAVTPIDRATSPALTGRKGSPHEHFSHQQSTVAPPPTEAAMRTAIHEGG